MVDSVPLIDISDFETGSDRTKARIASTVSLALEGTGFFVVCGHGVPAQTVADLRDSAWRFFDLPPVEKMLSRKPIRGAFRGYVTAQDENLSYTENQELPHDLKEFFAFGQF